MKKSSYIVLLTSASLLAWAAAPEAQLGKRGRSEDRPTIEVHLEAFNALRGMPSRTARTGRPPFQVKKRSDYANAPSVRTAPPPAPVVAAAPPPQPRPTPKPVAVQRAPAKPMPWRTAPKPALKTRPSPPPVATVAPRKPIPGNPPEVYAAPPKKRVAATRPESVGLPPIAPPYQANYQSPTTRDDDSNWLEDTTDYIGEFFGIGDETLQEQSQYARQQISEPVEPMPVRSDPIVLEPEPEPMPAPVVARAQPQPAPAVSRPPVGRITSLHPRAAAPRSNIDTPIEAAPEIRKPVNKHIAEATETYALPTQRSMPVGNAATYDGYELAQGLVDDSTFDSYRQPSTAPTYAKPKLKTTAKPIPLPKPTSPEKEVLLAEVSEKPITKPAPVKAKAKPKPKPKPAPKKVVEAKPQPVKAKPKPAPKPAPAKAEKPAPKKTKPPQDDAVIKELATLKNFTPPPPPPPPPAPEVKQEKQAAPKPKPVAKAEAPKPADNSNLNKESLAPEKPAKEATAVPPPPPAPVVAAATNKEEDQPWFEGLKSDLDSYFEEEKEAQEKSKEEAGTTDTKEKQVAKKEQPVVPPPPPPPPQDTVQKAATEKVEEAPVAPPAIEKPQEQAQPLVPPPPPPPPVVATKPEEPKKEETKLAALPKSAPTEPAPKPKIPLPPLSKITGDQKLIEESAKQEVKEVKPLPKLPTGDAPTPAKPEEKAAIKIPPPPPPPPLIEEPKEVAAAEEKKPAETVPEVKVSPQDKKPDEPTKQVTLTRDEKTDSDDKPMEMASLPAETKSKPVVSTTALNFSGSNTDLTSDLKKQLKDITSSLKKSSSKRLTIRAYASADKGQEVLARRIALARGLAVRAYLIEQGVNALRINVQSLGNKEGKNTADEVVLELKDLGGA